MRKLQSVAVEGRSKHRKRRAGLILLILLLLISSPLLYETSQVILANWRGLFGVVAEPKTPILNYLADSYHSSSREFGHWYQGVFNRTPWRSSYVIPFALFWTTVLAFLLRKC